MSMRRISIRLSEDDPDDAAVLALWDGTVPLRRAATLRHVLHAGMRNSAPVSPVHADEQRAGHASDSGPIPPRSSEQNGKKPLSALSGLLTGD